MDFNNIFVPAKLKCNLDKFPRSFLLFMLKFRITQENELEKLSYSVLLISGHRRNDIKPIDASRISRKDKRDQPMTNGWKIWYTQYALIKTNTLIYVDIGERK